MCPTLRAAPDATSVCRLCRAPLTPLQRLLGDVCAAARCRFAAARERRQAAREADLAARRDHAAALWQMPQARQAPVVWLQRHEAQLAPLPAAVRRAQTRHLMQLAAGLADAPAKAHAPANAPWAEGAARSPAQRENPLAQVLCAFCAGRCCRHGAGAHGFVTTESLRRWLRQHPGHRPADAAAAYLQRLPRHHVRGSCCYHARDGCTLPRGMRSDICNGYACAALRELQDHAEQPAVVAAMERAQTPGRAALLHADGRRDLPRAARRQGA